jgi:hypothetical protein
MTTLHYHKHRPHGSLIRDPKRKLEKRIAYYEDSGATIRTFLITGWTNNQLESKARELAAQLDASSWAWL